MVGFGRHIDRLWRRLAWATAAGLVALASPASAVEILASQGFDGDGMGHPYIVLGGGGSGKNFWGLASSGTAFGFTGSQGADYFTGRDLDEDLDGNGDVDPRAVELQDFDLTPFLGGSNIEVSILVAANTGVWESTEPDYLRIIAVDVDTAFEHVLEEFLPDDTKNGDLVSTVNPGMTLDTAFQQLVVAIPATIDTVRIRVEAHSNHNLEAVGFDSLNIRRKPEPETGLLVSFGLILLGFRQRRQRRAVLPPA